MLLDVWPLLERPRPPVGARHSALAPGVAVGRSDLALRLSALSLAAARQGTPVVSLSLSAVSSGVWAGESLVSFRVAASAAPTVCAGSSLVPLALVAEGWSPEELLLLLLGGSP